MALQTDAFQPAFNQKFSEVIDDCGRVRTYHLVNLN